MFFANAPTQPRGGAGANCRKNDHEWDSRGRARRSGAILAAWRPKRHTLCREAWKERVEATLLLRQFGRRVALRTVQRRKRSRVAGSFERNGGPVASVSYTSQRHSALYYRRGHALVLVAHDPIPGDRYRRGVPPSPRSAPCAVPGTFRRGLQGTREKKR